MSISFLQVFGLNNLLHHFHTFVWLRWRIRINQLRHGSSLGKALAAILLVSFAMFCVGSFVIGGLLGAFAPRLIPRDLYFLFWDGLIALFCFVWMMHVATDIQRSDAITFDRILHLPVSIPQAFVLNYLSSLLNMTLISLCVISLGFTFGSCYSIGPIALLFLIPLVFFVVAVTALTYQLQGWLAVFMSNPRRRRMVMIVIPLCIIVISQMPSLVATRFSRIRDLPEPPIAEIKTAPLQRGHPDQSEPEILNDQLADLQRANEAELVPKSTANGHRNAETVGALAGMNEATKEESSILRRKERRARNEARTSEWIGRIRQFNLILPPLWMAGCIESIMSGTLHVFWLTGAMALVGFVSLRRNYRQTIRFYKGETDARASELQAAGALIRTKQSETRLALAAQMRVRKRVLLVERQIPFVSEETAAVITMTLQSMMRAPEVKLYLLLPLIAPFVLLGVLHAMELPRIDELKAAIIVGFTACSLFITSGLLGNYFAYDRAGFRAFVLSPIQRKRILLGRNLATAPFLLMQSLLLALAIGIYFGMAIDKMLCAVILSATMLPLYFLLTNLMSILTPFPLAAGSIQPKQFNLIPVLFSLVLSMFMPAITVLALVPLGLEWLIDRGFPGLEFVPIAFLMSLPWLIVSIWFYRWLLTWEGKLLASREKEILRVVTSKIE